MSYRAYIIIGGDIIIVFALRYRMAIIIQTCIIIVYMHTTISYQ